MPIDSRGPLPTPKIITPLTTTAPPTGAAPAGSSSDQQSVTVDPTQPTSGSSQSSIAPLVPPPNTNPALIMVQVQSLQSKMSTNQMDSASDKMSVDQQKTEKSVKKYTDMIKKQHKEEKKSKKKGLISKIVDIVEDTVEITAGAALCFVPGGQVAGVALLATGIINTTDQALTGQLGGKAVVSGKGAEIMGYCAMGATIAIGVATCGVGLIGSGAAVAGDVAADSADAIEMTEMTSENAGDMTEDVGDEDMDEEDSSGSSSSGSSSDVEMTETRGPSSMERMEEAFEEGFDQTEVENAGGDGDGDGSDDGGKVNARNLSVKGMKVGARTIKSVFGLVNAAGGITQGTNRIEIGYATKKADDYEAQATDAEKDIKLANADMQSALSTLQNEMQQYQAINKDLTSTIMAYGQAQSDVTVQGFA